MLACKLVNRPFVCVSSLCSVWAVCQCYPDSLFTYVYIFRVVYAVLFAYVWVIILFGLSYSQIHNCTVSRHAKWLAQFNPFIFITSSSIVFTSLANVSFYYSINKLHSLSFQYSANNDTCSKAVTIADKILGYWSHESGQLDIGWVSHVLALDARIFGKIWFGRMSEQYRGPLNRAFSYS